ncbi:MAG TPA: preprotein translocase subunit SecG [Candidatus Eisenbacteria bacterium]|nr:preprotein translocase subunit SecG [Candidatus Eisenbacteria bacterium]
MPGWMKWAIALAIGFAIIGVGFRFSWGNYILTPFFVLNCLVLIIVVLLQSGKAADLAGAFGGAGSQTAFGPRGAATVLSQATTWCAVMFMVCALAMVVKVDRAVDQGGGGTGTSILQKFSKSAPKTAPAPAPVTPAPAAPQSSTPAQPAPAKP